jgi:hypothetical protein
VGLAPVPNTSEKHQVSGAEADPFQKFPSKHVVGPDWFEVLVAGTELFTVTLPAVWLLAAGLKLKETRLRWLFSLSVAPFLFLV